MRRFQVLQLYVVGYRSCLAWLAVKVQAFATTVYDDTLSASLVDGV